MPTAFAQIELMLIVDNEKVYFLVTPHSSSYSQDLGLNEIEDMRCIDGELLFDYYPLPAYAACVGRVISLKHSIVDTEKDKK